MELSRDSAVSAEKTVGTLWALVPKTRRAKAAKDRSSNPPDTALCAPVTKVPDMGRTWQSQQVAANRASPRPLRSLEPSDDVALCGSPVL